MKNAYLEIKDSQDNSSQKSYEADKNNDFFQLLVENARDLIFHTRISPTFRFDYVSPSSTYITGYTPEEFYADPFLAKKCIPPEDFNLVADPSVWDNPSKTKPVEIRWICKDGRMIWTEHMTTLTRDKHGKPEAFQIIARDVTERKKAEAALLESQQFNASLLENAPHATVVINPDTSVKYVNPAWERLNGWTLSEIAGTQMPYPWWPSQFKDAFTDGFKETMKQGSGKAEIVTQKKNGEIYWIDMNWASVMNNGELLYLIINSVDITERKRMEAALRESEEKFSKAFHSSPEIIAITTIKDARYVDVNDSYTLRTGYSREELIGNTTTAIRIWANDDDRAKMSRLLQERGRVYNEEFDFRMKSGEIRTWMFSLEPITIGGEPCLIGVSLDITERKQIEKALRESEEKFSVAFRAGPQMMTISNRKTGKFIDVNDSYVNTTGYSREEFIGHSGNEKDMWVNPEELKRMVRLMQEQEKIRNEEFSLRMKSGEIRNWLCSADTINIGGESCSIAVATDITERKRMEKALRESEEKFSKAFHAMPEAVSISRLKDGIFLDVNDSYLKANGYTREEVIGHTANEINLWVKPDERDRMVRLMNERGTVENEEFEFQNKSGEIRTSLLSGDIINIGGEPCVLFIGNDITERKQAEKKLQQAMAELESSGTKIQATNKELESFSYSVSHDLRSPLRSIDGFSQALLEDYSAKLDEKGQDYLNRLRVASQKMGELIDGLLKLSRLTRSEMRHEKVDLSTLANEIAARLQETHPKSHAKFVIGSGLTTNGDPQMLRVLLENLLGNAWKFTRKTRRAEIEFGITGNGAKKTFFIKDNGAGFDMAYKDKLFGAFQRLHDTTEFPGTGIGLATVLRIINRHGGSIRAEGAVGKGATFYFNFD